MSEKKSFSEQPLWKKAIAVVGGLWLMAMVVVGAFNRLNKSSDGTQYKCQERAKAVLAWREKCPDMSHMLAWAPFNPAGIYQKWCDCVESKFDVQRVAGADCTVSSATVRGVWDLDEVKASCGLPNAPR